MAKDIGKLVKEHALKSRPPLYQWMHAKYASLKPVLTQPRPSWKAVAQAAYEDGQNKDGKPYTRQVAWKTWRQLHQDMETDPATAPASPARALIAGAPPTPPVRAPAAVSAGALVADDPDDDPPPPKHNWTPTTKLK